MNRHSLSIVSFCVLIIAVFTSCTSMREGLEGQQNAIARVDGYTLTVEHAADLLANADESLWSTLPGLVEPIANLWIGYTLLATALASPDTFSSVDMGTMIQSDMDQEVVWRLRDEVVLASIEPTEEELRAIYEAEQFYTAVEVEQILLRVPEDPSQAQIDSVRRVAEQLRERALSGESFGELARVYSQDPTSASKGGSLGWVGSGELVPELDAVVLQMEPGSISETVRSSLGYHVVKVTDRREPDFELVREEYRIAVMERYLVDVEGAYIDSLMAAADPRLASGAASVVRQLALDPRVGRLSPAERSADLAYYRGGKVTLGDWEDFFIRHLPESRRAFSADTAAVAGALIQLVQNRVIVKAAYDLGFTVSEETADSIRYNGHRELFTVAAVAGLRRQQLIDGDVSIEDAVDQILANLLNQQGSPMPLERASMALKSGHTYQIYPERFPMVIDRIEQIRAGSLPTDTQPAEPAS